MKVHSNISFRFIRDGICELNVEKQPSNLVEALERQQQDYHVNAVNDSFRLASRLAYKVKSLDGSPADLNDREGVVAINESTKKIGKPITERRSAVLHFDPKTGDTISLEASVSASLSLDNKGSTLFYRPDSNDILTLTSSREGDQATSLTVQKDGAQDYTSQLSSRLEDPTNAGHELMQDWA